MRVEKIPREESKVDDVYATQAASRIQDTKSDKVSGGKQATEQSENKKSLGASWEMSTLGTQS